MGTEIIVAIIAAVSGGGLFKIFDVILAKRKNNFDEGKAFRDEYRQRIDDLEEDMEIIKKALSEEVRLKEKWKSEYGKLFFQFKQYQILVYETLVKNGLETDGLTLNIEYVNE